MDNPPNQLRAKLVSLKPNKESLLISSHPEEPKEYKLNNQWRINQKSAGDIWITNLSTVPIEVDDQLLNQDEEKQIFNGDIIASKRDKEDQDKDFAYVVCFMNSSPRNSLKRNREESLDVPVIASSSQSPKMIEVSKAFQERLQEELICAICLGVCQRCVTLNPCLHSFCNSCLLNQLKTSTKCPVCREEGFAVKKNPTLQNLIELVLKNFPAKSRQKETRGYELMELHGNITKFGGVIFIGFRKYGVRKEGKGHEIDSDGDVFEGTWRNHKKEGEGRLLLKNGILYKGQWVNNNLQNIDEIVFPGGAIYKGQTKRLRPYGKGTLKLDCGQIYEGSFKGFKKEGFGKYTWEDGTVYEGNWIENNRNGYGTMTDSDGSSYQGQWKNDKREGNGIMTTRNGDQYEGIWVSGALQPLVKIKYVNGETYQGEIDTKSLQKHGKGVFTSQKGKQYDGYWMNDKQHNEKEIYKEDNQISEGGLQGDKMDGEMGRDLE